MERHTRISRGTFVGAAVGGVLVILAIPAAIGLVGGEESYSLSEFRITYPYDDPREDVLPSRVQASVSFVATWPAQGFPGASNCHMSLIGPTDEEVGALDFELTSATDGSRNAPLVVSVEAEPTSAMGTCSGSTPSEAAAGEGYIFSGPTKTYAAVDPSGDVARPSLTHVQFDVTWATATQPGMHTCYLNISRSDGTKDAPAKFNVLWGENPMTFDVAGSPEDIADANVSCGPFEE